MNNTQLSIFFLLFGFVFAAVGGLFLFLMGQEVDMRCARLESTVVDCSIETKLLGLMPLDDVFIKKIGVDLRGF